MSEGGTDYKKIRKVIMINMLDYILYKEHEEYISKTAIVLDKHREHEVIREIEWYFIELPKFTKATDIDINDTVNQWLAFFSNDRRYVEMLAEKKKIFKEAKEEIEYLKGDAETRRLQDLRDRWEMDRISEINYATEKGERRGEKRGEKRGERRGRKLGEKRGKKLGEEGIIKMLFKNNMAVEEIAEKTGIKLSEILKIVNC